MTKKRIISRRKCRTETIHLNQAVAQQWRDMGTAHCFSDDSEIASFLLQMYKERGSSSSNDNNEAPVSHCIQCHQPLPRFLCSACHSASSRTTKTGTKKRKTNQPPQDKDLETPVVKVEREDDDDEDEDEPAGGTRKRKAPSPVAVHGGVDLVEVKVEAVLGEGEDVRALLSEEEEGSTLPVMFHKTEPAEEEDEDNDNDSDLTDDASDPAPKPSRKRRKSVRKADPNFKPADHADDLTDDLSDPDPEPSKKKKKEKCVLPKPKEKPAQTFECKHCHETFQQAYRLKRHSKIHAADYGKDRLYSCQQCRMTFRLKGSLDAHMRTHSGQRPYLCAICNLPFTRPKQTKQHVLSQHAGSLGTVPCFKCATCQAEFVLYKKFTTHIWRHTLERKFQCEFCSMAFFEPSSLRVHQRRHTGDKPFTCSECGLSFHQLSNLSRHVLTHSGERPYRCTICPATYPASQQLKRHLQGHRGEKPFLCQLCGASYTDSKSLKFHLRSHTGEKPFKCDQCDKEFARPASLRVHKRTHSTARPYVCSVCGAAFADNSNMHRHHRLKHLGKPKKRHSNAREGANNGGSVAATCSAEPVTVDVFSASNHRPEGSYADRAKSAELHGSYSVLDVGANGVVANSGTNAVNRRNVTGNVVGEGGDDRMAGSMGQGPVERLASQVPLLSASLMSYAHAVVPSAVPFRF